jgi:hypothetical protein
MAPIVPISDALRFGTVPVFPRPLITLLTGHSALFRRAGAVHCAAMSGMTRTVSDPGQQHTAPARPPQSLREEWSRLAASRSEPLPFNPAMAATLPGPARRWLTHAIDPGTPLWSAVELTMRGEIRIGRWHPFTAHQILAPSGGFIWAARSRVWGLPVTGYDRLYSGAGEMRWRLAGLIPVMSSSGADITRSAAGRLAGEGALLPTAFRQATWVEGDQAGTVVAIWPIGGEAECAQLRVTKDGRLAEVTVNRWGNPDGAPYGRYPFGVAIEAETAFAGVRIGSTLRAGWWWGTSGQDAGEFFRARITDAVFR